ncbi:MAG: hypothetical protein R3F43_13105 [bacterium]
MSLAWLRDRLVAGGDAEAIVEGERVCTYADLVRQTDALRARFRAWGLQPGETMAFCGDYSEANVTRFLAAVLEGLVAIPIAATAAGEVEAALAAAPVDWSWRADAPLDAPPTATPPPTPAAGDAPGPRPTGIIIMTSGSRAARSSATPGAAGKFAHPRPAFRVLVFLLPDHMGGVNTLFGSRRGTILLLRRPRPRHRLRAGGAPAGHAAARHAFVPQPACCSRATSGMTCRRWRSSPTAPRSCPRARWTRRSRLPGVRFLQLYGSASWASSAAAPPPATRATSS